MLPSYLLLSHASRPWWRFRGWSDVFRLLGVSHTLLAWIAGGGAVAASKYWQRRRERSASSWPSADAVVQAASVKKRQKNWLVEISYRYYTQQEYRCGKYRRRFRMHDTAESFIAAVKSKQIRVRFREDKPDVSVLTARDLEIAGVLGVVERPEA